jgi:hypothetical protein
MAVFTRQISTQVTEATKEVLGRIVAEDSTRGRAREADAVRAALHLGLEVLTEWDPRQRVELYASLRSGLEAEDGGSDSSPL